MPIVPTGGATRGMDVSASVPLQAASEDVAMSAMEVPAKEHLKRLSSAKVREAGEPALKKQAVATAPEQQHPLAGGIDLPKLNLLPLDGGVNGKAKMTTADGMTPRRGQRQMKVSFKTCVCLLYLSLSLSLSWSLSLSLSLSLYLSLSLSLSLPLCLPLPFP